jgi:hypothetical protein
MRLLFLATIVKGRAAALPAPKKFKVGQGFYTPPTRAKPCEDRFPTGNEIDQECSDTERDKPRLQRVLWVC